MLDFLTTSSDYSICLFLASFAFLAGLVDSIVGGGGLIQLPSLLIAYPNLPIPNLFGTNKIAAFFGTLYSAIVYGKQVSVNIQILIIYSILSVIFSLFGVYCLDFFDVQKLKPIVFILLVLMLIYTILRKDLGSESQEQKPLKHQLFAGSILCSIMGFYDGFFGPGTGSILLMVMVSILKFDFLKSLAYSKFINCCSNLSAILFLAYHGQVFWGMGIMMGLCNMLGSTVGVKIAFTKGNQWIRRLFICIMCVLVAKYGWEVFDF
ncbi:MAG: sulfite exporter TauE/SafE family protein [Leadbetterella sp.]